MFSMMPSTGSCALQQKSASFRTSITETCCSADACASRFSFTPGAWSRARRRRAGRPAAPPRWTGARPTCLAGQCMHACMMLCMCTGRRVDQQKIKRAPVGPLEKVLHHACAAMFGAARATLATRPVFFAPRHTTGMSGLSRKNAMDMTLRPGAATTGSHVLHQSADG